MRLSKTLQNVVLSSLCAFSALPVQAGTTVIDFNSLGTVTTNPTVVVPSPYIEDGFKLTTSSGSPYTGYAGGTIYALTPSHGQWMGSPAVYSGVITNYGSAFVLERADGGVFDLLSMDVGLLNNYPHFDVYGYFPQGGYVHQYTPLAYNYTTLQTITFGNDFKGVNKLVFSSVYAQVDNINLSVATVPEPETYALMLAGLGLVGFAARRRLR
ncbi:PEP-CTERM sorting domain-containing protein [Thiobacillus sp.]|uniref:PEP-CTERM sorting domain-containing protein n=1 Tax=Thiobacillus sp. TaxID=924 RepID=UPI0025CB7B48|nr:PEP-CTERM sorting domain-containing protein [Thiobacillus sp.]